ncbi:MAG: protein kinase [Planctomycetota bacterium]|nr:protein kinase [Planctomycetota bacterium]
MNRNFVQGRWILSQNWISRDLLREAYDRSEQQTGSDLCANLLSRGLLTLDQAEQARQAAVFALMTAEDQQADGADRSSQQVNSISNSPLDAAIANREPDEDGAPAMFESAEVEHFLKNMAAAVNDPEDATAVQGSMNIPPELDEYLPKPGDIFQGYSVLDVISVGSQGLVLRGRDEESGQVVAVKVVRAQEQSEGAARFEREAKTLCELRHPNIVRILDIGLKGTQLYYTMEEIEGETLRDLVKESLLTSSMLPSWSAILIHLEGIAGALAYCHDLGLIHRDVKPSNIVIQSAEKRAVLVDFGLVRKLNRSSQTSTSQGITKTGEILGTPAFMSPEQFAPRGALGEPGMPSDVWGFGATLYYCLTGNPPYHENTFVDIYKAVLEEEIKHPQTLNKEIPDWLNDICMQCLSRSPADRPTMKAVLHALVAHNSHRERSIKLWPVALAIFATAFISTLLILSLQIEEPGFVFLGSAGELTRNKTTVIEGRVNKAHLKVTINQKAIEVNDTGVFRADLDLIEGENTFLVALLSEGKSIQQRSIIGTKDTTPPQLMAVSEKNQAGEFLTGSDLTFVGLVQDLTPITVTYDLFERKKLALVVQDSNRFSVVLEDLEVPQILTIHAIDATDNKVEISWTVKTPKAAAAKKPEPKLSLGQLHQTLKELKNQSDPVLSETRKKFMIGQSLANQFLELSVDKRRCVSILFSRSMWQKAKRDKQQKAIDILLPKIDKSLDFIEIKEFSVGTLKMRIAIFEHRSTGIKFHLVPGDVVRSNWWLYPDYDWLYQHLESLIEGALTHERLSDFFYTPTTWIVREAIAKAYPSVKHYENRRLARYFSRNLRRKKQLRTLLEKQFMQLKMRAKRLQKNHVLRPFFVSNTEITRKQWAKLTGKTTKIEGPGFPQTNIPYGDVVKGLPAPIRLPTRLEWLYAASAGTKTRYYWGNSSDQIGDYQWSKDNAKGTLHSPEDHKDQFNSFGLIDVYGNASEWADPEWTRWTNLWSETTEDPRLKMALQMMSADLKSKYSAVMGGDVDWRDYLIRNGSYYFIWVRGEGRRWMSDTFGFRCVISFPN